MIVEVGKHYRTPFDPSGVVEVIEIERAAYFGQDTARVKFLHNHAGNAAGSIGRYIADELRPLEKLNET